MLEVLKWHQSYEMKRAVELISTKAGLPGLSVGNSEFIVHKKRNVNNLNLYQL